jgi:hypothetical protein
MQNTEKKNTTFAGFLLFGSWVFSGRSFWCLELGQNDLALGQNDFSITLCSHNAVVDDLE